LRKRAHLLAVGDVVQVEGVLRRRFWRAGAAVASRIDVEVTSLRRR
jgi:single-strand DNA-binding protein